ncbi:MAG: MafI family immunity protein [Kineosporiaceae bacterium]
MIGMELLDVLDRLHDRLPTGQVEFIRELIDAAEWGIALEQIADCLSEDEAPLRGDERAALVALNERMGGGERVPGALSTCPVMP